MWRDESVTVPLPLCESAVVRDPWCEEDGDDHGGDENRSLRPVANATEEVASTVRLSAPAASIAECVTRTVRELCAGAAAAAKTPTQWLMELLSRSLHTSPSSSQNAPLLLTWHGNPPARPSASPALGPERRPRLRDEQEPSRLLILEPLLKKRRQEESSFVVTPADTRSKCSSSLEANPGAPQPAPCDLPPPVVRDDDEQQPPRKKSRLSDALRAVLRFPLPKAVTESSAATATSTGVPLSSSQVVGRGSPRTPTTCAAVLCAGLNSASEGFDRRKRCRGEGCA